MTTNNAALAAKARAITPAQVHSQLQDLLTASAGWVRTHWLQIMISVGVAAVIVVALHFARRLGDALCRRSASPAGWSTVFGRAIARTGNFFIVMVAAKLVASYAGAPPEVAATINFLFTCAAVFQVATWAREIILGAIDHRTHGENYSGEALTSAMGIIHVLVSVAVFGIALIVVLDNLGVNVTGLIAGLGVGGIAIGLAAQGIFADLFAALAILFDRPFRRGDVIAYDSSSGTVEAIGLKSTRLRAATGEERIISNKNLLDKEIQNITRRDYRRIKLPLGLIYQTSTDVAERLPAMLKEIVEAAGLKFVRAGFVKFGDSTLDFELEFDSPAADFNNFYDARHRVGLAILKRFNAEGIAFAYPTQTGFTAGPDGRMILPYPQESQGAA